MRCWSGSRCRLFAYGPADATDTVKRVRFCMKLCCADVTLTTTAATVGRRAARCAASAHAPKATRATRCIASSTRSCRGVCRTPATGTITGQGSTADWSGTASSARLSPTPSQWENRSDQWRLYGRYAADIYTYYY